MPSSVRLLAAGAIAAAALVAACRYQPSQDKVIVPGVRAGNIIFHQTDSVGVIRVIGAPEYITDLGPRTSLWMYPSKGMGVQFGVPQTLFTKTFIRDTTVGAVYLYAQTTIDDHPFVECALVTDRGLTLRATEAEVRATYGPPVYDNAPRGLPVGTPLTGVLAYPGITFSFRQGKMEYMMVRFSPPTDSARYRMIAGRPIVAGQGAAGITLLEPIDSVRAALGEPAFSFQKLDAEYWFYPDLGLRLQFGIPPVEGQRTQTFSLDSSKLGRVSGIFPMSAGAFGGELCNVSYLGADDKGITLGTAASDVRARRGEPKQILPTDPLVYGMSLWRYDGITYFINVKTQAVDHIAVAAPGISDDAF